MRHDNAAVGRNRPDPSSPESLRTAFELLRASTEEHPSPPDGGLLIPYLVPLALLLLGLGVAGNGPHQFFRGDARRVFPLLLGGLGGLLVFAAIEPSKLASLLP